MIQPIKDVALFADGCGVGGCIGCQFNRRLFYFKEVLPAASISTLTFFFAMTVTVSPNVSVVVKHVGALENSTLSLPSLDGEASAVFSRAPTTIPPFWPRPLQ